MARRAVEIAGRGLVLGLLLKMGTPLRSEVRDELGVPPRSALSSAPAHRRRAECWWLRCLSDGGGSGR